MSSDFKKVLVKDDRLMVTDAVGYAVKKGPQQNTLAQFNATSASSASVVWNIQVPSEQTLVSRHVLLRGTSTQTITVTLPVGCPPGINVFDYGLSAALAPFPLTSLFSTMQSTINNNTVSQNQNDVLASMLRLLDRDELATYNGYCPNAYDVCKLYTDALGSNANVLGSWTQSAVNELNPRGSWVLDTIGAPSNALINANYTTVVDSSAGGVVSFDVTFTSTEPVMISPFLFADPKSNSQAMYGIQNLSFQFNLMPTNRCFRFAPPVGSGITYSVAPKTGTAAWSNAELLFNFLTPHPSDLLSSRNTVPYYELPRYISNSQPALGAGASGTFNSQSLQLNQVPDKLIIFVRKVLATQTPTDTDSFIPITGVRINWNNMSGILASATQQDLYAMSIANGSNQTWYEFSGKANVRIPGGVAAGAGSYIPMTGSVLVLEFGKDIQIVEDFYAPGSLGNFNLQLQVAVQNNSAIAYNAGDLELVVITMNSGVFVCERGTSSTYTGILTKQDVLDASSQEPYSGSDVKRMVGGGFLDSLKSIAGKLAPMAKIGLSMVDNPYAKGASSVLGALGYAKPKAKLLDRIA